jgi:protocatechuate 3,4-dioxygenase beta subunit
MVTVTANEIAVRRVVTTDDEGRYEVTDLPAGRYTITATKGSYVSLQYGQHRPFEPGRPIAIADGQTLERLNIALPAGSVIVVTVTDQFGEPMAGVQGNLQRYQYRPDGRRTLNGIPNGFFSTDDHGQFRAFGLMPGEYIVSASMRPMFNVQTPTTARDTADGYATTYYPSTTNPADAQVVTVGLSEEKPITFSMVSMRMARISGVVVDSSGRPAAGAELSLSISTGGGYRFVFGTNIAPDGTFTATNIPLGSIRLQVTGVASGFGDPPEYVSVPLTVTPSDITGLKIVMEPPGTISGTIVFAGSASRTGPAPIRVNPVTTSDDPGAFFFYNPNNGLVDTDGHFEIRGVSANVLLRAQLPPQWMMRSVTLDGADITDEPLDVATQRNISGVVITLTDRLTDVSGAVTNTRGEPVKEYAVVVVPAEEKAGTAQARYVRVGRPDQDGRFDVRALPPGAYYAAAVEMHEQGREWDPEFQRSIRQSGKTFTLREGETVNVQLPVASIR